LRALVSGPSFCLGLLLLAGCGSSSPPFPSLGSSVSENGWVPISGDTYGRGSTVAEVRAFANNPHRVRLDVDASPEVVTTTSYEVDCDQAKRVGPAVTGSTPLARAITIPTGPDAGTPGQIQCFITARATKPASGSMTVKLLIPVPGR
jgi:hypothetical protein